jgi:alcohol dehydrogenase class IV
MTDQHAEQFAPHAFNDPSTGGNPVPMTTEHFVALYRQCINGQLSGI